MYVRSPIYRKIRDVIQSCKINAVATFLGGMLRNGLRAAAPAGTAARLRTQNGLL